MEITFPVRAWLNEGQTINQNRDMRRKRDMLLSVEEEYWFVKERGNR